MLFLRRESAAARIDAMKKYVQIDSDSIININSIVKLKINPSSHFKTPLLELEIDLDPINIKFSKQKIIEVLDFTTSCIRHNEVMLKSLLEKAVKKVTAEQ